MESFLPGIPPTGKLIEVDIVVFIEFRDGLMSSERIYWDQRQCYGKSACCQNHDQSCRSQAGTCPFGKLLANGQSLLVFGEANAVSRSIGFHKML